MSAIDDIRWDSAARTDVSRVRKLNEDAYLARPTIGLWAVADGMGGHEAGDFASARVVTALDSVAPDPALQSFAARVWECLQAVNGELHAEAHRRQARIIGTTVVSFLATGREAAVIWAGDSRAYRLRKGRLEQLTRDHSRIQSLIEQGQLRAEDAERHPEANVITRAVGVTEQLELDTRKLNLKDGDTYLLCSDGLYRYVSENEMTRLLGQGDSQYACDELVALALEHEARDNVTAIVMRVELDDTTLRTRINPTPTNPEGPDGDPTVLDDDTQELP
jgi:protein phosphatase